MEIKKLFAKTLLVAIFTGLLPVFWSVIVWGFEVDNKIKTIDELKKKVDNIHWYLIERNKVNVPKE